MEQDTMIGVDLARSVFQLHGASMAGHMKFRKKLTRHQFRQFMAAQAPVILVMEACGSANYWAREMIRLGHEVKLTRIIHEAAVFCSGGRFLGSLVCRAHPASASGWEAGR